jgi:hypothetical protein
MLETGHFALETHACEIAALIGEFLPRVLRGPPYAGETGRLTDISDEDAAAAF